MDLVSSAFVVVGGGDTAHILRQFLSVVTDRHVLDAHLQIFLRINHLEAAAEWRALFLEEVSAHLVVLRFGVDWNIDGSVDWSAFRRSDAPTVGEDLRSVGYGAVDCRKVVGWFVVVGSEETRHLAVVPTGNGNGAVVVWEVADDVDSAVVVDTEQVSVTCHRGVVHSDGHLDSGAVDGDLGVWEDLDLLAVAQDSHALLDGLVAADLVVVDDDAE